jgi:hypothetical protein
VARREVGRVHAVCVKDHEAEQTPSSWNEYLRGPSPLAKEHGSAVRGESLPGW